jgi:hypothetical protein
MQLYSNLSSIAVLTKSGLFYGVVSEIFVVRISTLFVVTRVNRFTQACSSGLRNSATILACLS